MTIAANWTSSKNRSVHWMPSTFTASSITGGRDRGVGRCVGEKEGIRIHCYRAGDGASLLPYLSPLASFCSVGRRLRISKTGRQEMEILIIARRAKYMIAQLGRQQLCTYLIGLLLLSRICTYRLCTANVWRSFTWKQPSLSMGFRGLLLFYYKLSIL